MLPTGARSSRRLKHRGGASGDPHRHRLRCRAHERVRAQPLGSLLVFLVVRLLALAIDVPSYRTEDAKKRGTNIDKESETCPLLSAQEIS
jgi:hypothetical protein